jgi:CheY-like chemotaxis protein
MAERIRILVVDDHHVVRQGLVALLNIMPGIEVVGEAGDGLQAIELHRTLLPDVTLMDLQLPTLGGVDAILKDPGRSACRKVRRTHHLRRGRGYLPRPSGRRKSVSPQGNDRRRTALDRSSGSRR